MTRNDVYRIVLHVVDTFEQLESAKTMNTRREEELAKVRSYGDEKKIKVKERQLSDAIEVLESLENEAQYIRQTADDYGF